MEGFDMSDVSIRKILSNSIFFIVVFCLYIYIYNGALKQGDIVAHISFMEDLANGKELTFVHTGFHYLGIFISKLTGISFKGSTYLIMALSSSLFLLWIKHLFSPLKSYSIFCIMFICFGTSCFNFITHQFYLGQFANVVYHNPTFILSRIISIVCIYYFFKMYEQRNYKSLFILSFIMAYQTFIKPNFTVTFFSALFFLFLYEIFKRNWQSVINIVIFTLPSFLMACYLTIFSIVEGGLGVGFLNVLNFYTGGYIKSLTTFGFSLIAPIVIVVVLKTKKIKFSKPLIISMIACVIGIFTFVFFFESGSRFTHANYAWSMASGYSLLYFYIAKVYFEFYNQIDNRGKLFCNVALLFHVLSGACYWIISYSNLLTVL